MPRAIVWTQEQQEFRSLARDFFEKEVKEQHARWEVAGIVPRSVWEKAGSLGLICPNFPAEYGGAGVDFLYNVIVIEESSRIGNSGFFISLHADVIAPYILHYASEEQKKRWLPGIIDGTKILAIAMTEPDAGSDLGAIKSTAVRNGDHYILNGSKTFISNGYLADLVIVVARTNVDKGIHGISLLMVEAGMAGFERGRRLKKIGLHAQDTSEMSFSDVKVPLTNLLGREGYGFRYLMSELAQERLSLATANLRSAEAVLELTIDYVKTRKAFGGPLSRMQNIRFKLADMATEQAAARAFLDQVLLHHVAGNKAMVQASQAKLLSSEMLKRHVDECLQMFGGYGYMMEYPIARAYLDARVQTIYAGTSEIMREIIAGSGLGL
ncbi:MAG: acyl-CoA dehydrogenase family protein [Spirochaetales bacterium]|nr:acyl-CoA dehydrogenase family protein [Spirochaetales bacterium]